MTSPSNIDPNDSSPESRSDEFMTDNEFKDLMDKEFTSIRTGEIAKGTVISIDKSGVVVDIGYKSEGMIPLSEFEQNQSG